MGCAMGGATVQRCAKGVRARGEARTHDNLRVQRVCEEGQRSPSSLTTDQILLKEQALHSHRVSELARQRSADVVVAQVEILEVGEISDAGRHHAFNEVIGEDD